MPDPTDVLTRDQLRQLAYDLGYLDKPIKDTSDIRGGPTCQYASNSPPRSARQRYRVSYRDLNFKRR